MSVDVESFYRRFAPMVFRRCRSLLNDEDEAGDALHDVFVELLRRKSILNDSAPSSLLYTMATNICLNRIRKAKRGAKSGSDDLLASIASEEDHVGLTLARMSLDRIFSADTAGSARVTTKTLAVLHYLDGYSYEETARITGLSVSGIRKRLRLLKIKGEEIGEACV